MRSAPGITHATWPLATWSAMFLTVGLLAACTNYDPRDYDEDPPASSVPAPSSTPSAASDSTVRVVMKPALAHVDTGG